MAHSDSIGTGAAGAGPMNWPNAVGPPPTVTVAVTALVAVLMTETVLEPLFAT